jgi:hypothetical protein
MFITFSMAWPVPSATAASMDPMQGVERTTQTASYKIKIRVGPTVTMSMSTMTMMEQGRPVNRHIEVHIFNKGTGTEVKDVIPTVKIKDQAKGTSRALANVMACRVSRHREIEPHFGDNIYLPDGKHTITVSVGKETAVYKDLVLKPAP